MTARARAISRNLWLVTGGTETVGRAASDAEPEPTVTSTPAPDSTTHGFGYNAALDGLRALAVLSVIAYHDNYAWAKGGFLGVDLFFVLSGFLITTLLVLEFRRGSTIRLAAFWARRARRLLPALLGVLAFVALYTHFAVVPWERNGVRDDMFASLFYFANWRFIFDKQGYFELFSATSPLRHMWSLAIEEQYYLVWPLIVLACLRIGRGSLRILTWVCVAGGAASMIAMWLRFHPGDPSAAYYATDARAHSLLIGALLAVALIAWKPAARARRLLALAAIPAVVVVAIAAHITSGTGAHYYHGGSALFAVVVAVLIAGVLQAGPVASVLSIRPLAWIGRISYGLYLWHWPIDVRLVPSRVHVADTTQNQLRLAVTFVAAGASYYLVERPIRERTWTPRISAVAFVPAAAAMIVVISASAVGATAPPGFIWGYGDPLLCGPPRPNETHEAVTAQARSGPLAVPTSARGQRVLIVGDSTACSLWPGLNAVGNANGIATDQGSVFGCGVASGEITTTRNESITPHSSRCPELVDADESAALARSRPTIVLWMSIWEKSDLVVDGHTVVAGTPAGEKEIMARMDAALARLTAGGAHVVMITEAAAAPNPAQGTQTTSIKADNDGYTRLNALLARFQARHADQVTLVDLASKLCPSGPPCPAVVDGLHARPDGRHFTPTAATWAARYILTQIFDTKQ
jgi:peptidoglycan/LPS O-acetylase OafA/YrhL